VKTTDGEWGAIGAFLRGEQHLELDHSATVKVGPAHGDLHGRNIMFSRSGPVFIDFAHYQASESRGVPLLDLAKLLVDSWVFVGEIALDEIASGQVLERASCRPFLLSSRVEHDERRLFRLAVQAQLCRYQAYPDVPTPKKEEALRALSA
jgi:aminoglycoside phosphotransferase (APT) family kinase protein